MTTTKQEENTRPEPTKALTINDRLEMPNVKARFNEILGKKAAGFVSSIISAVKLNPQLAACPPDSVISSAMIAATLDLPINPSLGFAHIVPYKDKGVPKAQFQMGWKGYNQLGLRTGQFARMNASPVYEGQLKSWDAITGDFEYDLQAKTSDNITGYVSYFRLINGYEHYLYMTVDEIKVHANRYSASYRKGYGAWKDKFEDMCLKTVHKRNLSKWAPLTQDMELALRYDQGTIRNYEKVIDGDETMDAEYPDNDSINFSDMKPDNNGKTTEDVGDALKSKAENVKTKKETKESVDPETGEVKEDAREALLKEIMEVEGTKEFGKTKPVDFRVEHAGAADLRTLEILSLDKYLEALNGLPDKAEDKSGIS